MAEVKSQTTEPLLSPLMRWFLLAMILANIAGTMSRLLMPIYLTELGASVGQVGLVFTLASVAILALQVLGGWISDNIGRLRAIAIGSVGGVIGFFLILLAPTWQWMLVALTVSQVPYALVGPSFGAFIAENSSEANRGRVYGLTDTIYQVTGIIGPPLGGVLARNSASSPCSLVAAIFYSMAAGLAHLDGAHHALGRRARAASAVSCLIQEQHAPDLDDADRRRRDHLDLPDRQRPRYRFSHVRGARSRSTCNRSAGCQLAQIGLLGSFFSAAMMLTPILSGKLADRYGDRVPDLSWAS